MIDKDSLPIDKPRRTPDHPTKSHVVKTRVDGKEKIIRFGEQGASTAGKPKEGESDAMKQKRASFKARHAKNIAKGKSSPAYWANKTKWAAGGAVGLEELDEKYEGIKKPDFSLLESFQDLIRTLQSKAADAGTQEFDPVRALGRSGAAGSLEDLYEAYADEPRPHAARVEAGGNANPDRAKTAKMVFDSFKGAGFSDAQAKALTAEINREGSFNPAYLYGSHTDAANKATNVGMLSWQGDRANRLMSFMADRGLIDPAGRIVPGQEALNAQAMYLRDEMENDPSYARTRETFLGNPNIDPDAAHDILGKNFIRWRIDDPKYRGSGFDRISEGYDILNMAQGFAEGGLAELTQKYAPGGVVEEDELAEAERLRDLQLMAEERNPNAVAPRKPGIADLPGGIPERLALINQTFNPVEAIGGAMRAGRDLMDPDAGGYDRLAALGNMLSGVAGVAGPAAIAKRVGAPAAAAVMESLLGASPTSEAVADMARKYAVDEYGGVPVPGASVDESGALRMYHGSPHDFDRFSMSKIGTGEGAQAYGQGLYFAENEGIARSYRDNLLDARIPQVNERLKELSREMGKISSGYRQWKPGFADEGKALAEEYDSLLDERSRMKGRMYEVNVNANPEDFLDWDKPLSEQSAKVQEAFGSIVDRDLSKDTGWAKLTGSQALDAAAQRAGVKGGAEEMFRSQGIPGIRYLDAGSRSEKTLIDGLPAENRIDDIAAQYINVWGDRLGRIEIEMKSDKSIKASERSEVLDRAKSLISSGAKITREPYGTRNYVIFDENLINIVRKYGIAGAAAMLGMSQADVAQAMGLQNDDQKYAEGGSVNADEEDEDAYMARQMAAQMQALYDEDMAAQGNVPRARSKPQDPSLMNVGGIGDRLALVNKYLNPVEAIGGAMRAGSRLTSADASGYDRLAALGDMLSGVAGVAGPAAVAKRVGTPAAAAVMEGLTGGAPAANAAPFGKDWSDVYHWSRSPDDFSEFNLNQSKSAMSQLGPHVGTPQAAEARYMGFAKPEGTPPALGFTLPMKADLSKPFLNPVTGKPWTEMDLEMFISAVSDTNSMDRRLVAPFMRERLAKEGYTSIPYMNDVEDAGSVSHIMLADRPTGSDAVLRSRFAKFDPAMRASKNISAGAAVGAAGLGASQYDPDAIESRASKAGKNEFAAGGAVKYDPSAVDRIINQLREVNRG